MVLGLCRLLLRDPVEAEDAAQQVFLSAHRAVLGGSIPREAPAWLAAIARNECRARIHARMREPLALPDLPSDLPDPLASAIRAIDLDAVWSAISSLPRRQRRALVLREVGGLSYRELGRALGVSHSSVQSLLFRARQQVRSLLAAANTAALPYALRDDLARLIPGFDPGSAGMVARVAAVPLALKLATVAAGVTVVTTGATEVRQHQVRPAKGHAAVTNVPTVAAGPVERPATALVADRRSARATAAERGRREATRAEDRFPRARDVEHQQRDEPQQPEQPVVEREPAQVEPRHHGSHDSGSESDNSGSSPDHSGSSGHDLPDGTDG